MSKGMSGNIPGSSYGQSSRHHPYKIQYSKLDPEFDFPYCKEVGIYDKISKIGQGTFGEVFKAKHRKTGEIVALKKILMDNEKEGFPITALREVKILQKLKNDNVVHLKEICRTKATPHNRSKATFFLVCEFCDHDLAGLLSNGAVKFSLAEIKTIMSQLLNGLYYIHTSKILHRDMKAANILITKQGVLKLADFGLARTLNALRSGQQARYTNRVVTLWYRPPELLLGERNYGPPIDMWGAGCIMAEMWTRSPIMQGQTEQHQLQLISQLCGSITPEVWPGVETLDMYKKLELPKDQKRKVKDRLRRSVARHSTGPRPRLLASCTSLLAAATSRLASSTSFLASATSRLASSTSLRASYTSLLASATCLLASSTSLLASSTSRLASSTSLLASATRLLASSTSLRASARSLLASSTSFLASATSLQASSMTLLASFTSQVFWCGTGPVLRCEGGPCAQYTGQGGGAH